VEVEPPPGLGAGHGGVFGEKERELRALDYRVRSVPPAHDVAGAFELLG
jgi:hypothetical protein